MNIDTKDKHKKMCICHISEHKGHCLRNSLCQAPRISVRPLVCKQRNQFMPKNLCNAQAAGKGYEIIPFCNGKYYK